MRIAGYEISLNDDPYGGIGLSIFCCGCHRNCIGCHNRELQSFDGGYEITPHKILEIIDEQIELIDSVIYLGGDWINYPLELYTVTRNVKLVLNSEHRKELSNILYTGEVFENIDWYLTRYIDVVIDGTYDDAQLSSFSIPASSNQRVFIKCNAQSNSFNELQPKHLPVNKKENLI